jgi:hypothetical protein
VSTSGLVMVGRPRLSSRAERESLTFSVLVYRLLNPVSFVAFKMGRLRGGPSRTGAKGAYLDRYVTDEQRSSRPIFNATLWAAASWLFFSRCSLDPYDTDMGTSLARLEGRRKAGPGTSMRRHPKTHRIHRVHRIEGGYD